MTKYNENNFFMGTKATFVPCDEPNREPDYVSNSGSAYWYDESGVIRSSNHWGSGVASCDWYMDGIEVSSFNWMADMSGFCAWDSFESASYDTVTVYGVDAADCDDIDFMGVAYKAYAGTPDMMSDGYVYVCGQKVAYDRFGFMSINLN